ncbi:MAG TPA: PfkB family carbohydrate kinase [Candidatus Latescibacteria bacterium]|nr:PfkB family carbohydrate kinase [Candidatus Latescibacterota bacterium]HJP29454.1 PfkB family carbohydrate kinase [Candidatus Latescibacterota bacterium]
MTDDADVAGIGLITTDYLYRVPRLPAFGTQLRASGYARACGGPAATAMACLARLGARPRFVGKTGNDHEGDFVDGELRRFGVEVSRLRRGAGPSRVVTVLVEERSGERGFLSWPEAFRPFVAEDLRREDVAGVRVVLIDDADDVGLLAARWAKEAGAIVVFDGTWQSDQLDVFLPLVDHAVVGEFFARRWLPEADDDEILHRLTDMGAGTAVLTLGDRGCIAVHGQTRITQPAFQVDVVDTTGAGDAFHGGYVAALLEGAGLAAVLRFAAATAALNCRALGGQQSLPTRDEVEAMLHR